MVEELSEGQRITLGADKAYDTADFVFEMRQLGVTPHVSCRSGWMFMLAACMHSGADPPKLLAAAVWARREAVARDDPGPSTQQKSRKCHGTQSARGAQPGRGKLPPVEPPSTTISDAVM
jgi:hypothetical protein